MLTGRQQLVGGYNQGLNWFYFDPETGAELRDSWKEFPKQGKWCHYGENGVILKGQHQLPGGDDGGVHWFYFDEVTGAEFRNCWKPISSQGKVCYYGSDGGAMYKGRREINGRDYYFDEATGTLR
ncbi:unnamed protein product [Cylicostephanus goldi]|uniref:Uncharacterized protein n=1 Tax=Cylicostephanus goldi TaxID=71465 RepID=A0A3P6T9I5_CYLGO|nr:unnamed protein product [Cylicostephanus goldi]